MWYRKGNYDNDIVSRVALRNYMLIVIASASHVLTLYIFREYNRPVAEVDWANKNKVSNLYKFIVQINHLDVDPRLQ
jgi:Gpi18-like mannosyltransferase